MKTRPIGGRFIFHKKFEPTYSTFEVVADTSGAVGSDKCKQCDLWIGEYTTCIDGISKISQIGECHPNKTKDGISRIFKKVEAL